jgi:hypothetical protein
MKPEYYESSAVLYGYETWPLTLREECRSRLKVFENRVLRGIILPKRGEIAGRRKQLLNQELHK